MQSQVLAPICAVITLLIVANLLYFARLFLRIRHELRFPLVFVPLVLSHLGSFAVISVFAVAFSARAWGSQEMAQAMTPWLEAGFYSSLFFIAAESLGMLWWSRTGK